MNLKISDYGSSDEIIDKLQDLYSRFDTLSLEDTKNEGI